MTDEKNGSLFFLQDEYDAKKVNMKYLSRWRVYRDNMLNCGLTSDAN